MMAATRLGIEVPDDLPALVVHDRPGHGETRRLWAAGDVGFSGRLCGVSDPFQEIAPVLRRADLAFANLETPLVEEPGGRLFAAPTTAASQLAKAGFTLLNLANNHILDHGREGLSSTCRALRDAGLEVLGTAGARLVITRLGGLEVGWLGAARTLQNQGDADGFWEYEPRALERAVAAARGRVNVLVVSIHMGYMFVDYPHPGQRREVRRLLESGADLVLLHHAHVLQGIETFEAGGLACYSLGNLLLDWQEGEVRVDRMEEEQRSGGLFLFDLDRRGVRRAAVVPVRLDDSWTIRWALGDTGRSILERVRRLSDWRRDTAALFHRQLAERATPLAFHTVREELRRGGIAGLAKLVPRLRPHHLRMVAGWLGSNLRRKVRS